jgi:hypothetical protein
MRKWSSSLTTEQISAPDVFCLIAILSRKISCLKFPQEIPESRLGAIFEALRIMLTTRWWDRIWVVQEAVVAEHMVVRYGNASMPWKMLATVAIRYHGGVVSNLLDSVSSDDTKVLRLLSRVRDLDHFRQTWRAQSQKLDLLALLRQFCNRNSSDSRDKIFALLGLCDQSQTLNPDYSWNEVTVYVKYLIQMIQQKESLSPLNGDIGRKNRRDIPSWVPDWNATFDESDRGRQSLAELYDACGGVASTVLVFRVQREVRSDYLDSKIPLVWEGWDPDKASSQIKKGMARLLESLESESQPEAYLPEDLQYWLKDYMRFFQSMNGDDNDLDAIFNKLIAFCHPQGQRHPTRFVNHSLLTFEYDNQNGCADGSLVARGRFLGTVSKVFEPLYSCNDTKAVLNGTKHWFFATERWFATEWFARRLQLEWSPFDGNRYDLSNLWTVFAETLLSSAKLTENGLERLGIQDNAHLATWLWRVVWKADPAQQTYHFQKMYHRLKDILLQIPFLDTEISDPRVAESYSAAMRLSITKRAFFITNNGRIGLGPVSMQESDEIYVLPGGKMPFVLRRIPHQNAAFSLVGECYLHGCMDGQMGLPSEGGIPDHRNYFQYWHRRLYGLGGSRVLEHGEPDIRLISII